MRITNNAIMRGYNRDLNRVMTLKNNIEHQITTQRQFARASESPLNAAKALKVRKSLYDNAQYTENLKTANKFYTEAETSLLQVSDKMATITETIVAACNSTKDLQDLSIYAQQLETSAWELCAIFNTDSAGRSIFGGESNNGMPFEILNDSEGNPAIVTYNGVPVNATSNYSAFPYSNDVYIDIGLGMGMNQQTHEADSQTLLCVSFNGAKVSGCGSEYGVADIDLSKIQENRNYCLDVYAGETKKTITFTGQATQAENVKAIQEALDQAFAKEKSYNRDIPVIDDQGVIYVQTYDESTASYKTAENGICCVVNTANPPSGTRYETLEGIDNDSGYTNKFKINVDSLTEGATYSVDVTVGDETKTITFVAGTDNFDDPDNPVYREEYTVENIQAALDEAFGYNDDGSSKVNISKSDLTRGIISAEGQSVKVEAHDSAADSESNLANIYTTSVDKINLSLLNDGETYTFNATVDDVTKKIVFDGGATQADTISNLTSALSDAFDGKSFDVSTSNDKAGVITYNGTAIGIAKATTVDAAAGENNITPSKFTTYNVDLPELTSGTSYTLKVMYGSTVKDITFTAGGDSAESAANIQSALDTAFGTGAVSIDSDGAITAANGRSVVASNSVSSQSAVVERERVYSNNYIQLTLDAARALRNGDIEYANGCLDRIASAEQHLLVEIANLGCNEEFIDFNIDRITTRDTNLMERQNDLEALDPASAITLWKQYEAMYNACLQMSSSVVPNSIFNYI